MRTETAATRDALEEALDTVYIWSEHIPPSQNACYRNLNVKGLKGRAKTQRYRDWLVAFGWDVKRAKAHQSPVSGPYAITITICRSKRHHAADIMNREKPLSDALQELGVIDDDQLCERGTVQWGEAQGGVRIEIERLVS